MPYANKPSGSLFLSFSLFPQLINCELSRMYYRYCLKTPSALVTCLQERFVSGDKEAGPEQVTGSLGLHPSQEL